MKLTANQSAELERILDEMPEGKQRRAEVVARYREYLAAEVAGGRIRDLLDEAAEALAEQRIRKRLWDGVERQGSLFDRDAWITLGDTEIIRMREVRGAEATRNLAILTKNNTDQNVAYGRKAGYWTERIPLLYALGCTLEELEDRWGDLARTVPGASPPPEE